MAPSIAKVLISLARFCYRAPRLVLLAGLVSAMLAGAVASRTLSFTTDRTQLLRPDDPAQLDYQRLKDEFGAAPDMLIWIRGGTPEDREQAAQALVTRLQQDGEDFADPSGWVDLPFLKDRALLYLTPEQVGQLAEEFERDRPWLAPLLREGRLEALLRHPPPPGPQLDQVLEQLNLFLQGKTEYHSPFAHPQPDLGFSSQRRPGQTRVYQTRGEAHLVLARPNSKEAVPALERLTAELHKSYAGLTFTLGGEPVLRAQETRDAIHGAMFCTLLSIALCNLLFVMGFGQVQRPQLAILCLLIGLSWAFALAGLLVGQLNLITVNFPAVLVGLGIDFGIHWLFRYQEERSHGLEPLPAMERTMATTGVENFTGALTTSTAFLALQFTHFRAASQLGLISGLGVMLAFVAMATFLPAFLFLIDRGGPVKPRPKLLLSTERWLGERPRGILVAALVFSVWCAFYVPRIGFDYNLLHMQVADAPALKAEKLSQRLTGHTSLIAFSLADDRAEAMDMVEKLRRLPSVESVECVASLLPARDSGPEVERLTRALQALPLPPRPPQRTGAELQALEPLFREFPPSAHSEELRATLRGLGPGRIEEGVQGFEKALFDDLRDSLTLLKTQKSRPPISLDDLPDTLKKRNLGRTGKFLIRIYPRGDAWERPVLEVFVREVQAVDPHVTGSPVLIYRYLGELTRAYSVSWRNALAVICLILLVHFRSLKLAGLALFPKLLGVLWMLGLMGVAGVQFNPANFMALQLTLGIGLVFGVHVIHNPRGLLFEHSTGPAVALSALCTVAGYGTLMLASHRGIASLGFVMAVGVLANLVAAVVVLPALLRSLRGV